MADNKSGKQGQQETQQAVVGISKHKFFLLSKQAEALVTNHVGYRCTEQVEKKRCLPLETLNYEINVLYNDDILDTITILYGHQSTNVEEIDYWIKQQLHTDEYKLTWLTSDQKDAVKSYSKPRKRSMDLPYILTKNGKSIPTEKVTWDQSNRVLLISDCGSDGQLIAYTGELGIKEVDQQE